MGLQTSVTPLGQWQDEKEKAAAAAQPEDTSAGSSLQSKSEGALSGASSGYKSLSSMGSSLWDTAQTFDPVYSALASEALDYDPQWLVDQAATDTRLSYGKAQGIMERNMSRYGINPNSGAFVGKQDDWARALAAAEAGAKTKAARDAMGDRLTMLQGAAQTGQGFVGAATSATSAGAGGLQSVAGAQGSIAGGQAELAGYEETQQQVTDQSLQEQLDDLIDPYRAAQIERGWGAHTVKAQDTNDYGGEL